jgi:hypothetical protein
MLLVTELRAGELAPTLTYARRGWVWLPADKYAPDWDGADGHLTITLQKTAGGFAKATTTRYLIEEQLRHGWPGRVFLILKPDDPDQEDVYECFVADDEPRSTCSCKAGKCKVDNCVHRDSLRAVIEAGGFDL